MCEADCCAQWVKWNVSLQTINGQKMPCLGTGQVKLQVHDIGEVKVDVIVVDKNPLGYKFILGMNGIEALGGVFIRNAHNVEFGAIQRPVCGAVSGERNVPHPPGSGLSVAREPVRESSVTANADRLRIDGEDFQAMYDPIKNQWLAEWKWSEDSEPSRLTNQVESYSVPRDQLDRYEAELKRWIAEGWLVPYDVSEMGPPKGLIPLMAVLQERKQKVRPVLDYRELNAHIDAYTADADVCAEKMRTWRRMGVEVAALDLKSAYLQIHVKKSLWCYQTVVFEGRRWALTRLGFGINVAPIIMKAIVNCVLSLDTSVREGTSSYVDDILVREDVVSAQHVQQHLASFGLLAKEPERVCDGTRLLGLVVRKEEDKLLWTRESRIDEIPDHLSRRTVFSLCGKLLGHYPVCSWLRVATAFIKRRANAVTQSWDEPIQCAQVRAFLTEMQRRVSQCDPVHGRWDVSGEKAHVWVDASSLAIGALLEVDGDVVEDASWLRSGDVTHINMAELDAVVKGLNMALAWGFTDLILHTDSATVYRWISDGLSGKARLRTKAASEMLIRRRIALVTSLVSEYKLKLSVQLVPSAANRADELTRVPQRWLRALAEAEREQTSPACLAVAPEAGVDDVITRVHHDSGHPGVRRTLYFVKRVSPTVTKRQVRDVVARCDVCHSIDPAPVHWRPGRLEVERVWSRLGVDITHYGGVHYLTLVDCGPSRYTLWRPLKMQTSAAVIEALESVFLERGAPEELLLDNDTAFRSRMFESFVRRWEVKLRFRCAYAASGNGVTERCHRSVKVIAARSNCTVAEAVHLYNVTPRDDESSGSAPANMLYRYEVVRRGERNSTSKVPAKKVARSKYTAGDQVWVKPPNARCHTKFSRGVVTGVLSEHAVEVEGVPRHVRDLRPCAAQEAKHGKVPNKTELYTGEDEPLWSNGIAVSNQARRPERRRRQPDRLKYE